MSKGVKSEKWKVHAGQREVRKIAIFDLEFLPRLLKEVKELRGEKAKINNGARVI
ncbi:hypothetical protein RM545_04575 [Zunongwangia sp. F260]|uniref:Uncharacterized protein n=1 Tax=Autumnicola lenta TaxID=3075593 RepID=A0ABU3CJ29_9FLAO|nr:hypothetical protein [Zunongwangia sp. F260]MDT0645955.1 hypothetical protein [Zunongwangia sp. F260]